MKNILRYLFILCLLYSPAYLMAQISQGGTPPGIEYPELQRIYEERDLVQPDLQHIKAEDQQRMKNGLFMRVGVSVPVNVDMNTAGSWVDHPKGGKVWRLVLRCENAEALGVYFDHFYLPPGAEFFVYNADHSHIRGAYTEVNNKESGAFAIELVRGDVVALEYYEPERTTAKGIISISELAYVYRNSGFETNTKGFGDSDYCQVNINCSEGNNWQDEKKGVARLFLKVGSNYGWCSGTLVNNVRQDCTPYFLTADHCGDGASTSDLNQWVFHFSYEASGCSNPSAEPSSQTITGATLKSNGGNSGTAGSDFYLVELSSAPPANYDVYFNGWDNTNTPSSSGVSIHHPSGDIKKISTYTSALTTSGWNGSGLQSHWRVTWTSTANGHGVTEGGSSGSPIFNASKRVVGDLTGGSSYCSSPNSPDMYGKFSYSWDQNGSTAATRLKDWLDPDNTGATVLDGMYCNGSPGVDADFTANTTNIPVGGTVDFTDLSTGSPTSWSWTFNGGTPPTETAQNPTGIQYNTAGVYTVSLTASNAGGSNTETKTNYIVVGQSSSLVADFTANQTSIPVGGTVDFTDLTVGNPTTWDWSFPGGTPTTSNVQNPMGVQYNTPGTYLVSLTVTDSTGIDNETKQNYIIVGGGTPGAGCDSLRYPLQGTPTVYKTNMGGYATGNNGYGDLAKAEYFDSYAPYVQINGGLFWFGYAQGINSVTVAVWDNSGPNGKPGITPIATKVVPISTIAYDVSADQKTYVAFSSPVMIPGPFYMGIILPTSAGDTVALVSNGAGQGTPCTAWEQHQNGQWVDFDSAWNGYMNIRMGIFPRVCELGGYVMEDEENAFFVYPNPNNGNFQIGFSGNSNEEALIEVFDIHGKMVFKKKYQAEKNSILPVSLQNQATGLYLLRIHHKNHSSGIKILIQ